MNTILETNSTETNLGMYSILEIKDNEPTSQMQHDSDKAMAKTTASKDGHCRRNTTGEIGIPYKSVKILSQYLASTADSCHGQCNYDIRSKPILKLSTFSAEDPSRSKEISTDVRYIDVLASSSSTKLQTTVGNGKDLKTSKLNRKKVMSSRASAPSLNLHSVKKGLTQPVVVSLAPKRVARKYTSQMNDKLKRLQCSTNSTGRISRRNSVSQSPTCQDQEFNMEKISMNVTKGKRIVKATNSTARKLNFGSGKVIKNQPVIAPSRRLKIKQRSLSDTRVVDVDKTENQNGEIRVDDADTNSVKVVLERQDKKESQNLLNNMMEKTVNKQVETRKSKVKVMVGEFETLISSQHTKAAASMINAC